MKRIISLILALVLCLALCACGSGSKSKAIVGEWLSVNGNGNIVFNKDGTGSITMSGEENSLNWKYDKELDCYVISSFLALNAKLVIEDNVKYVHIMGTKFYHPDSYEQGVQINLNNMRSEIAKMAEGKEKLQLNKPYTMEKGTITYTDISASEDGTHIVITASITNTDTQGCGISFFEPSVGNSLVYYYGGSISGGGSITWEGEDFWIESGETMVVTGKLYSLSNLKITETLDAWGEMPGIIGCAIDETKYYINVSDFIKK